MTRFRSQFQRAGSVSLLRGFGESIVYYPKGIGSGRPIEAMVERNVAIPSEVDGQVTQAIVVRVLDSATSGISNDELDDQRDEILVALIQGGPRERRQVTRLIDDPNGLLRLQVR